MLESILTILLFFTLAAAAYLYALSRERAKLLTQQTNDIKVLREDLKQWQNKALPTPLGFETRERKKKEKGQSPLPKILQRAEVIQRIDEDERMKPQGYDVEPLKYTRIAEKVKAAVSEIPNES